MTWNRVIAHKDDQEMELRTRAGQSSVNGTEVSEN
jgi:hypothetical protein